MVYDLIIVGGGISGMTCALYALRNNKSVLIIEKENFGGQIANSPLVDNYPCVENVSGLTLMDTLFNQIYQLGVKFELEEVLKIGKLDDGNFLVITNYNAHEGKAVVLANGVKHRMMKLPNEENLIGKGISFCAVCDGPLLKNKEAYLIGDANTALKYATLLADYCSKVNIFTLFDHFFGDQKLIDKVTNNDRIIIRHNMNLVAYKGENKLEGLVFENTVDKTRTEFLTDNVFIAIGQVPNNEMFSDLVELNHGYIVTNEKMETKTPGLFAIGDTRKKEVRQLVTASSDGAIASLNAINYLNNL